MRRFLPALGLIAVILVTAPAIGQVRNVLFKAFPQGAVRGLFVGFAAISAAVFLYVAADVRRRPPGRRWRGGVGLGLGLGLLWIQTVGFATDVANVDAAEKVHVVEYGLLAFLLYRALKPTDGTGDLAFLWTALAGAVVAGTLDEAVQWVAPRRTGEIRDVAINAVAGLTGLVFALALSPPERFAWRLEPARRRLAFRAVAVAVLVLGSFFFVAHLAYEIDDPEVGRFRSRFTAAELQALAAERRLEWSSSPPTGLAVWGVEDYFLTEAAFHASHRNAAWQQGDWRNAWLANRILEKYYDPFLDIHSFRGSGQHRYPPPRRQKLERRKGKIDPRGTLSPVLAKRYYPWSKPLFLTGLVVIVLALWTAPRFWPSRSA